MNQDPVKLLLVDDKPANLLALEAALRPLGEHLVSLNSGEAALRAARGQDFAVVLLDVMMPGLDGLETIARLRAIPRARETPILFITAAQIDERQIARGYALGAVDYMLKPFTPEALRAKVAAYVRLYRSVRELQEEIPAYRAQGEESFQILVTNDNLHHLLATEAALRELKVQVVSARSGREALGALLKHDIALILMDVHMPDMDGFETAMLIRQNERFQHVPIVFVTATTKAEADVRRGYEMGAVDFLFFPIQARLLCAKVQALLDQFRSHRLLARQVVEIERLAQAERLAKKQIAEVNATLEEQVRERTAIALRAERSSMENQTRYRNLFEQAADGIFLIGADNRFLDVNPAGTAMLGRSREELLRMNMADALKPCARACVETEANEVISGQPHLSEWEARRMDGTRFAVEVSMRRLDDQSSLAIVRDLTQRKQAEALINGQKQVLEMIAADAPLPEALTALVRLIESQAPGMLGSILLLDEDGVHVRHGAAPGLPAEFVAAMDGEPIGPCAGSCGTAAYRKEAVFVEDIATDPLWAAYRAAAQPHGLHACWSTPIFDARNNVLGTFAMYYRQPGMPGPEHRRLVEVTTHTAAISISRHRAEAALRESEGRLRLALTAAGAGIWTWEADTGVSAWDERFHAIYGFTADQPRSFDAWMGRLHPADRPRILARLEQMRTTVGDDRWAEEFRCVLPGGTVCWHSGLGLVERDATGAIRRMVGIDMDITARKQAQAAVRNLTLQLTRAEDAERRRIARELHDSTGQKLAALSMNVGLLQDAVNAPGGQTETMFADCLATIDQCAQEIRTHSYLLHPPLLDELGLAAAISDYVEGFSKRSGVRVTLDAPPDFERLPDAVEIALFRVVQESLGNIHRHAGAAAARIRLACDAEQVTLEVSDAGRGMSAETLRAVEAGRGVAGVGIAGMRERLRWLGGRLEIESGGQGTTVRAIVPRGGVMREE